MEVRPGYKRTEVGLIPEEWDVKPLSSVLRKGRLGGNYPNQNREADHPLMKMGNLARGYMDLSKVEYISPSITPDPIHMLHYGDVLFNTRNTLDLVGKVAIWRDELPVAFYNSNLMRLEFDPQEVCSSEYANCALNSAGAIVRLRALATGTTSVAAIYTRDLLRMPFIVPPQAEQRAIATALSDVDALLAKLDALIAKKRDLKQAAMQQLLTGQTRLPGFSGEWEVKRLEDMAKVGRGRVISHREISNAVVPQFPVYSSQTFNDGVMGYLDTYDFDGEYVTWTTDGVNAGKVFYRNGRFNCTNVCGTIKTSNVDAKFLSLALDRVARKHVSTNLANPKLMNGVMKKIEVAVPTTLLEQAAIATVLSDMDAEIAALEARRDKTRALKQGMMQELLTGRIRLV
jgi:type I restriction enzyme, S subunit